MSAAVGVLAFLGVWLASLGAAQCLRRRRRAWREWLAGGAVDGAAPEGPSPRPRGRLARFLPAAGGALLGAAAVAAAALLITGDRVLAAWAAPLGLAAPVAWLAVWRRRRRERLLAQLEGALRLAAGALRSGQTLPQALEHGARYAGEPLASELRRVVLAMAAAVPADTALREAQLRIGLADFDLAAAGTRALLGTAGSLADLYGHMADAVRQRHEDADALRAETSWQRLGAGMITAVPFAILAFFHLTRPDLLAALTSSDTGRLVLAGCLAAMGRGWLLVGRLTRPEIG